VESEVAISVGLSLSSCARLSLRLFCDDRLGGEPGSESFVFAQSELSSTRSFGFFSPLSVDRFLSEHGGHVLPVPFFERLQNPPIVY